MLLIWYVCLGLASAGHVHKSLHNDRHTNHGKPLPLALAKPSNVAPDVDCAFKELAWDYAQKLMTTVSVTFTQCLRYRGITAQMSGDIGCKLRLLL